MVDASMVARRRNPNIPVLLLDAGSDSLDKGSSGILRNHFANSWLAGLAWGLVEFLIMTPSVLLFAIGALPYSETEDLVVLPIVLIAFAFGYWQKDANLTMRSFLIA